jgi:hypothetical protein
MFSYKSAWLAIVESGQAVELTFVYPVLQFVDQYDAAARVWQKVSGPLLAMSLAHKALSNSCFTPQSDPRHLVRGQR